MGKTILVTGATDGIGLRTASMLAERGHALILHGRSADKLEKAAAQVGHGARTVQADLSDLSQVAGLANNIASQVPSLDVLINNAGVYKTATPMTLAGRDTRFVVNTIAPYLLTKRLLPIIPKTGRVINLSSAAQAPVDLDALQGKKALDDMAAYAQSKRAIAAWTVDMARKHPSGPVFIAVNPGSLLASKMVKEGFGVAGKDLSIGADILCRASLDERFAGASGRYFDNDSGAFAPLDPKATTPEFLQKLIAELDSAVSQLG